jgi:hypothetical protein
MSLRTLHKHRTDATYAQCDSSSMSSKATKHKRYAISRFNRALRRTQREVIAVALLSEV